MNKQDTARKLWLVNYEARYPAPSDAVVTADTDAAVVTADTDAAVVTADTDAVNQLIDELEGQAAVAEQDAAIEADQEASRT
jgi:hypothetical protein